MAQISWFYTFPYGRKYEIGLYHSEEGHVVVYCDGEIMNIAFQVLDDKTFSFYIENKLLQISIKKESSGEFTYLLEDSTPVAILTNHHEKRDRTWKIWLTVIIVTSFTALLIWIFSFYRP